MKGNFFKIIFRTLAKHKTNTFINITGLMVGLSSAILIMNYIYHELSFAEVANGEIEKRFGEYGINRIQHGYIAV